MNVKHEAFMIQK